jgi:hypothetical protein
MTGLVAAAHVPRQRGTAGDQKGHFCKYFFLEFVLKYLFKKD